MRLNLSPSWPKLKSGICWGVQIEDALFKYGRVMLCFDQWKSFLQAANNAKPKILMSSYTLGTAVLTYLTIWYRSLPFWVLPNRKLRWVIFILKILQNITYTKKSIDILEFIDLRFKKLSCSSFEPSWSFHANVLVIFNVSFTAFPPKLGALLIVLSPDGKLVFFHEPSLDPQVYSRAKVHLHLASWAASWHLD